MHGGTKYFWPVASVLALAVAAEFADGGGAGLEGAVERAAPVPAETLRAEDTRQSPADAAVALARPLFTPGRRPASGEPAGMAGAGDSAVPRLTGIIVGPEGRRAIFARLDDGAKGIALGVHGRIGAFTVEAIEAGAVALSGPGGTLRLQPRGVAGGAALPPGSSPAGTVGPVLPPRQDPGRFTAPVGPLGVAIYSFSPAAPPVPPPPVLGFDKQ